MIWRVMRWLVPFLLGALVPLSAQAVAAKVSAGSNHSVVLRADGVVWTFGHNASGQLGDGTKINRSAPVQVNGLAQVVDVAAGDDHTVALKADGTVWTWGSNSNGKLGNGTTAERSSPLQVGGLSGVLGVAGGGRHTLAVKSDGTVWAWGYNFYGQLGDGTVVQRLTPVQVLQWRQATTTHLRSRLTGRSGLGVLGLRGSWAMALQLPRVWAFRCRSRDCPVA